jgi:hypothetical protein
MGIDIENLKVKIISKLLIEISLFLKFKYKYIQIIDIWSNFIN